MWCILLQIKHMKRFIEQEAQEKAEEIMIKVGVVKVTIVCCKSICGPSPARFEER